MSTNSQSQPSLSLSQGVTQSQTESDIINESIFIDSDINYNSADSDLRLIPIQSQSNYDTARHNVRCALVANFFLFVCLSISLGPLFDKFLFQLGHGSNIWVGLVESLNGIVCLIVFIPVAKAIDSNPDKRAPLIYKSTLIGLFSVLAFAYSITLNQLPILYIALSSNGFFYEYFTSSMGALFTDSSQFLGELQKQTVRYSIVQAGAGIFGPMLALILQIYEFGDPALADYYAEVKGKISSSSQFQSPATSAIRFAVGYSMAKYMFKLASVLNILCVPNDSGYEAVHGVLINESDDSYDGPQIRPDLVLQKPYQMSDSENSVAPWNLNFMSTSQSLVDTKVSTSESHHHYDSYESNFWGYSFIHKILLAGLSIYIPLLITTFQFRDLEFENTVNKNDIEAQPVQEANNVVNENVARTLSHGSSGSRSSSKQRFSQSLTNLAQPLLNQSISGRSNASSTAQSILAQEVELQNKQFESARSSKSRTDNLLNGENDNDIDIENSNSNSDSTTATVTTLSVSPSLRPYVPYLVSLSDIFACLGAGMSCKFLNLFLIENYNLTGIEICVYQLVSSVVYVVLIQVLDGMSQRYSESLGRTGVSFVANMGSVFCFWGLGYCTSDVNVTNHNVAVTTNTSNTSSSSSSSSSSESLYLSLFLSLLSNLSFAKGPLDKSIILETTPQSQRGQWNAIESFVGVSFGASSFIGGYLSDSWGSYQAVFRTTGWIWLIGVVVYIPLMVGVREKKRGGGGG